MHSPHRHVCGGSSSWLESRWRSPSHRHHHAQAVFLWPAFWLTVYSLVFDVVRWIFEFRERQIRIPIALVLYALFLWRMWKTRRQVSAVEKS